MRTASSRQPSRHAMQFVAGGTFIMGSDRFYPEEAPTRKVKVDGSWIDETPVTNRDFARFVDATGHRTFAEIAPDPADYPGMHPDLAKAGSLLFRPPSGPVDLNVYMQWWVFELGADWRHPLGPDSGIEGLEDHPVAHADARAYAKWAGKSLPTEAEWGFAARGGLDGADFAWGDELAPEGRMMANYWQGKFPHQNNLLDGWERTSPDRTFPPNGYGLSDMIGNVWEWTQDWYSASPHAQPRKRKIAASPQTPGARSRQRAMRGAKKSGARC